MKDATRIMKRNKNNPIILAKDYEGVAQIFNPSPVKYKDETILLVSVIEHAAKRGFGRDVGQTRVARSKDGIHFKLEETNFIDVQSQEGPWNLYYHFIDNRRA